MNFSEAVKLADTAVFAKTKRHLKDLEVRILEGAWQGQKYDEIAKNNGYAAEYLMQDVGPKLWKLLSEAIGEKVSKTNFQAALERHWRSQIEAVQSVSESAILTPSDSQPVVEAIPAEIADVANSQGLTASKGQDWGEAVDVSTFFGRSEELATLEQWIVKERCRLVALLGMGGIGKTALSVKLAQQIQNAFDCVIWRSLRNAPPVDDILADLIKFLSNQQETALPESLDSKISRLLNHLRSSRCLLILDNVESILREGDRAGRYREGYEGYDQLLRCIGETPHQSCLVITSREKPKGLAYQEGKNEPVRSLQITGLTEVEGQEILKAKGIFSGSADEWRSLVKHYAGNPLALKMVAPAIQDIFENSISKFLQALNEGALVFDDIRDLLERQFNRLTDLEKKVMYWLAINREIVFLPDLKEDILQVCLNELIEALASLQRRALIEKNLAGFTQQPVVMEYITEKIIDQACQNIITRKITLLRNHTLLKAQAKEYIRDTQARLIVEPVINKLLNFFGSQRSLEKQLAEFLSEIREKEPLQPGYVAANIINMLVQLKSDLSGYNLSHLNISQAYLQGISLRQVNLAHSHITKSIFTETFSSILCVVFSPNGQFIATGDADGQIRLWRVVDGQQLWRYKAHTNWVRSVAFSPDGQTLASGSADCTVKLYNIHDGQRLKTFHGHTSRVWSVAFSPDGQTIASGSDDQTIKLWDMNTGECLKALYGHTSRIRSVVFSSDGETIASGSDDLTVRLWDANSGECLKSFQGHTNGVRTVVFSPDGQTLASSSGDGTVKFWNINTNQCLKTLQGHTDEVWPVVFSPDGQTIASGSNDSFIKLWDTRDGKCLKTLQGHSKGVWSIAFSPDGQTLVSGSYDSSIKLWDTHDGKCLRTLQGYTNGVRSVACSPDNKILAISSADHAVRLWNIDDGKCFKTLRGHTSQVWSVAFSHDGQILASASEDRTIKLWDIRNNRCLKTLQGHTNWVWSVAFSPDGQTLASSSDDCTIKLWNIRDGKCIHTLQGHTNWVWSVAFSPDGQVLASSSSDQTIRLWDINTKQCLKTLPGHTNGIRSIKFNPDGQTLASGSEDSSVRLWDASTGECLKILQGHTDWVWSVAFSPDGETLASCSNDQTIRLWNVHHKCIKVLQGHTNWVRSLTFTPDGNTLISGSEDETTKLWNIKAGDCFRTFVSQRPYEGMNITGITGLTEAQKGTLKALGAVEFVEG